MLCAHCGSNQVPPLRRGGGTPRRYCSLTCRIRAREARRLPQPHTCILCGAEYFNRQRGSAARNKRCPDCRPQRVPSTSCDINWGTCRECDGPFVVAPRGRRIFCSQLCGRAHNWRASNERRQKHRPQREVICPSCSETFTTNKPQAIYCSARCSKTFRKTRRTIIGGTGLRVSDLPPTYLELARLYRQMNREVQRGRTGQAPYARRASPSPV